MKEYIKAITAGFLAGITVTQLLNMAVQAWTNRPFTIGGEFLLPALFVLIGYIVWTTASEYFSTVKYKEIYRKGYDDGLRINKYKIIVPVDETLKKDEKTKSA